MELGVAGGNVFKMARLHVNEIGLFIAVSSIGQDLKLGI